MSGMDVDVVDKKGKKIDWEPTQHKIIEAVDLRLSR
jgi:hypothetical protein